MSMMLTRFIEFLQLFSCSLVTTIDAADSFTATAAAKMNVSHIPAECSVA